MASPPAETGGAPTPGEGWVDALCMGCEDAGCTFVPMRVRRRGVGEKDVEFELKYCGVCHSDLHTAAGHLNDVMPVKYPVIPGHELAGVVTRVGEGVTKFKVGDHVGVGCMVDSCLECEYCRAGEEQRCARQVATYQSEDWSGRAACPGAARTVGGYSSKMVVNERFGIKIPASYPLEMAGPVLCAGITMYDPMIKAGVGPGVKVGVVGLGGLGATGVKIAKALGATVTAISRSNSKRDWALSKLRADAYLASADSKALADARASLDLVVNTIPTNHDVRVYSRLLTRNGTHVLLGLHATSIASRFLGKRSKVRMSTIGGLANTQRVVDLCAEKRVLPEVEIVSVNDLNRVYEALDGSNDAGKRYVLDIAATLNPATFDSISTGQPTKLQSRAEATVTKLAIVKELFKLSTSKSTWF